MKRAQLQAALKADLVAELERTPLVVNTPAARAQRILDVMRRLEISLHTETGLGVVCGVLGALYDATDPDAVALTRALLEGFK